MLIRRIYGPLVATTVVGVFVACSSDDAKPTTNTTVDAGSSTPDAGGATEAGVVVNTIDGGVSVTLNGADIIAYDPSLPFTTANVYAASGPVLDARWGNHGGPLVTTTDDVGQQTVTRWTLSGTTATAATLTPKNPFSPPASTYASESAVIDLPFDNVAFTFYSPTTSPTAAGEAILLSPSYDTIVAQAFVNGFTSGVGVTDGTKTRVVYGAVSGITADVNSATQQDSAVYASDITATSQDGGAGDGGADAGAPTIAFGATAEKVFSVAGAIGPITTDADGNLFVSTTVANASVYAITASTALGVDSSAGSVALTSATALGTRSLAVGSVKGSGAGWVFAKGTDPTTGTTQAAPVYAGPWALVNGAIGSSGAAIPVAILGAGENTFTVFNSPNGHVWVAVNGAATNWFVELAPK